MELQKSLSYLYEIFLIVIPRVFFFNKFILLVEWLNYVKNANFIKIAEAFLQLHFIRGDIKSN